MTVTLGRWKARLAMLTWGGLGVLLVLALLHLWTDHRNLHALVDAVQKAKAARGPS